MNFNQLTYVCTAAKYHSINKAAKELFLTPSALSQAIGSLEAELGYSIFYRDNTGIFPTDAGNAFLKDVKQILAMEENWKVLAKKAAQLPARVTVSLSAIPIIYNSVIGDIIINSMAHDATFSLNVKENTVSEIEDGLFQHAISFAIQGYDPDHSTLSTYAENLGLNAERLYIDHYTAFVGKCSPLYNQKTCSVEQLTASVGLSLTFPSVRHLEYQKIFNPDRTLYFYNYNALLQYLAKNNTFTILPEILTHNIYCKTGLIRPLRIADKDLPHAYALITPSAKAMTPAEKAVAETIKSYFQSIIKDPSLL